MVFNTIDSVAEYVAREIKCYRAKTILVEYSRSFFDNKHFKKLVFLSQPVLIACIESMKIRQVRRDSLYLLIISITYTDILPGQVINSCYGNEYQNIILNDIKMHRRYTRMVVPKNSIGEFKNIINNIKLSPYSKDFFLRSTRINNIRKNDFTDFVFIEIKYSYSCGYKEHQHLKKRVRKELDEIVAYSLTKGEEDWKKAFLAVEYCVIHWSYGEIIGYPDREYTSYGALVHHAAVCMGISLATCVIFNELGIPCKYVRGTRNGCGHAWNLVYICGGWFYIDVTDAISRRDPFYHWGMTSLNDRELTSEVNEKLKCSCPASFLQKNGFRKKFKFPFFS